MHEMLLRIVSSEVLSASASTTNFRWVLSILNLHESVGLSNCWLAPARDHHGHLELNRRVVQAAMVNLARQLLEVLRLPLQQTVLRVSEVLHRVLRAWCGG